MKKIIYFLILALSAFVYTSCGQHVNENKDFVPLFERYGASGNFAFYDVQSSRFQVYNFKGYRDSSFSSLKAYYCLLALMGVETGAITNETAAVNFPTRRTHNLIDAIRGGDDTFFVALAKAIPTDRFHYFIDSIPLGLYADTLHLDKLFVTAKLTSDQLLGFVKKMYAANLPFQPRTFDVVLKVFEQYENTTAELHYLNFWDAPTREGTLIGWVEVRKRPYFFTLRTHALRDNFTQKAQLDLLFDLLKTTEVFVRE